MNRDQTSLQNPQPEQSLRCSHAQSMDVDGGSGLTVDMSSHWPASHASLTLASWEIFHVLSSVDFFFFQNQLFRKILSGIPSECQTDWIQVRPDVFSGLIWTQSDLQKLSALKKELENDISIPISPGVNQTLNNLIHE